MNNEKMYVANVVLPRGWKTAKSRKPNTANGVQCVEQRAPNTSKRNKTEIPGIQRQQSHGGSEDADKGKHRLLQFTFHEKQVNIYTQNDCIKVHRYKTVAKRCVLTPKKLFIPCYNVAPLFCFSFSLVLIFFLLHRPVNYGWHWHPDLVNSKLWTLTIVY